MSSRSEKDRYRPDRDFADRVNCNGGMPPASRNHPVPTGGDTPANTAASSLERPAAIANQNDNRCSRRVTGGRPGEYRARRVDLPERRFLAVIATSSNGVLRRPVEAAQYTCGNCRRLLALHGIAASMSREGNCLDNAPMESSFGSLKTELVHRTRIGTRAEASRALFENIESSTTAGADTRASATGHRPRRESTWSRHGLHR